MNQLSQWADDDEAGDDDNIIWDDSTEKKLVASHGGFHPSKRNLNSRLIKNGNSTISTGLKLISLVPTPSNITTYPSTSTNLLHSDGQVIGKSNNTCHKRQNKSGLGERKIESSATQGSIIQKVKIQCRHSPLHKNISKGITKCVTGTPPAKNTAAETLTSVEPCVSSASSRGSPKTHSFRIAENPEEIRRLLFAEVKQMSIERLVADAKRYRFLEDYYQKQQCE
jgi:hypothetical protein